MISNEYQDAKCRIRIPGQAGQVLSVIERLTFGWNKKEANISYKTFRKMTGLNDWDIWRAKNNLIKMRIISHLKTDPLKKAGRNDASYRIQMDYTLWILPAKIRELKKAGKPPLKKAGKPPLKKAGSSPEAILNTSLKDNYINTAKPQKSALELLKENKYEKAREIKIKTLHKKYKPEFEKAKRTKNLDWLDSINNKIKEGLAEFSHKYHLRKGR